MESAGHVTVPLRAGGKKMRKRRELDALVAHSLAKRACNSGKRNIAGNGVTSQDQLLSQSTDEQEEYTWPKVRNPSRCRRKRMTCLKTCGPFVLIMCVFMSFGFMYWLYFDLRQQINEYRMRIEQVSATSQNVPEALQKWHETSKNLEQNQSVLHNGIAEIREILKNFSIELTQLKDIVDKKNENSKENELSVLQNSVADFGAKIRVFTNDIDKFKEQFTQLQSDEKLTKENLTKLTNLFENSLNRTNSTINSIDSKNMLKTFENMTNTLNDQIKVIGNNLSSINYTLSQRVDGLDVDLRKQKSSFDKFLEDFANISSKVSSLDGDWTQHKQPILLFEEKSKTMETDLIDIKNKTNYLTTYINQVQTECQNYHREAENLTLEIDGLKTQTRTTYINPTRQSFDNIPISKTSSIQPENVPSVQPKLYQNLPIVNPTPSETVSSTYSVSSPQTGSSPTSNKDVDFLKLK